MSNQRNEDTLISLVSDKISQLIIDQKYKPGDRLPNEFELADSLGVSRNTVREAVKYLIAQNVLEIKRGRGTYIREDIGVAKDPLGFRFITDKYKLAVDCIELRLILEPEIARICALRATEADIQHIEYWMLKVEEQISNGEDHTDADIEFHSAIAKGTQNLTTSNIVPILAQSIPIFIEVTDYMLNDSTVKLHRKIYEAIVDRNSDAAYESMRSHIKANEEFILNLKK